MKSVQLEFKRETGRMPILETILTVEESEFIQDHYLVAKTDVEPLITNGYYSVEKYQELYVEWLEQKLEALTSKNIQP